MATPDLPEPVTGAALLPVFAAALIVAVVAISLVIAVPTTVTLAVAIATVIGFTAGLLAYLGRLIGPDEHRPMSG